MAITGLENNTYPNQVGFYDANRRERMGGCYAEAADPDNLPADWPSNRVYIYGGAYDANVQQFTLDCTDTSEANPKKVTTFTLANGCHHVIEYYGPDALNRISATEYWEDKAGNQITDIGASTFSIPVSSKYGEDFDNKLLYITPPSANWSNVGLTGTNEVSTFNYTPTITWRIDNSSPYDPPALNGIIAYSNFNTYYSSWGRASNNPDIYNDWLAAIEAGGDDTPITPINPEDDPSGPGGGEPDNPDYDPTSDPVDFPDLPTGGDAISTGFIRVYSPTAAELRQISAQLWSDSFVNTIKKIQNDPMEAIISLHNIPFDVRSGAANCVVGNYNTGVTTGLVPYQWYRRDLGSINIPLHWASALDYAPYVSVDCFIPYLGVRSLQVDDVIGKTLQMEMVVDVISGAAIVHIKCGASVLYTYNTSVTGEIPVSQSSYAPMYNAVVGGIGNSLSGYGQAGAPGAATAVVGSAINVALSKQHSISRGGSIGGNTGCMGSFTPYLIIHRPIQSLASGFRHFKGYPSNITTELSSVSGYTEIESIHLDGIKCTEAERNEIRALLYNGVIF